MLYFVSILSKRGMVLLVQVSRFCLPLSTEDPDLLFRKTADVLPLTVGGVE